MQAPGTTQSPAALKPTPAEMQRVHVLSDGILNERARVFAQRAPAMTNKQLNGVLEFARSLRDLITFVVNQRNRKWSDRDAHMQRFYTDLYEALMEIVRDTRHSWGFVPQGSSEEEAQQRTALFADMLAREFTQHLVAEMLYVRRQSQ